MDVYGWSQLSRHLVTYYCSVVNETMFNHEGTELCCLECDFQTSLQEGHFHSISKAPVRAHYNIKQQKNEHGRFVTFIQVRRHRLNEYKSSPAVSLVVTHRKKLLCLTLSEPPPLCINQFVTLTFISLIISAFVATRMVNGLSR